TRFVSTPGVEPAKPGEIPVARNVAVPAKEAAGTLPEISNDHNVSLIISGAGFEPCLPLTHLVGRSQVCVPVTAPALNHAELVDQKVVDQTATHVGPIKS